MSDFQGQSTTTPATRIGYPRTLNALAAINEVAKA